MIKLLALIHILIDSLKESINRAFLVLIINLYEYFGNSNKKLNKIRMGFKDRLKKKLKGYLSDAVYVVLDIEVLKKH